MSCDRLKGFRLKAEGFGKPDSDLWPQVFSLPNLQPESLQPNSLHFFCGAVFFFGLSGVVGWLPSCF